MSHNPNRNVGKTFHAKAAIPHLGKPKPILNSPYENLLPAAGDPAHPEKKMVPDLESTTQSNTGKPPSERESPKSAIGVPTVRLVPIGDIRVSPGLPPCNPRNVSLLARSPCVKPIDVIDTPAGPLLIGDLHWLEAAKALGKSQVECLFTGQDQLDARLTEIVEIIHHAGLPILDTAPLVEEWVQTWMRANDSGQVVQEFSVGRPHGGIAQAARVLCVPGKTEEARRKSIERSMKIAKISSEAKAEAKRLGLDDNQSALLAIANVTPEEQVAKAQERAARKRGRRRKHNGIMLDAPEPKHLVIGESHVLSDGPDLPPMGSPPTIPKEHGADPHGDAFAERSVNAPNDAAFDTLVAAWAAASEAVRHRFVIEIVQPDMESSFGV
jgi:hypothetical protein